MKPDLREHCREFVKIGAFSVFSDVLGACFAVVRPVPKSYENATTLNPRSGAIDVARAAQQHLYYRKLLVQLGFSELPVESANDSPDSVFVEDTLTYAGGRALLHRSGHPGRRCESSGVRRALLNAGFPIERLFTMDAPACADGGDVLRVGSTLFVGLSDRTNQAGVDTIRAVFQPLGYEVRSVHLPPEVLHLKCVCSMAGSSHLVLAQGTLDRELFSGHAEIIEIPYEERYAANVVGWGGQVIVAEGYPETKRRIRSQGFEVIAMDTSEFRKGDGSLTCLSVLLS